MSQSPLSSIAMPVLSFDLHYPLKLPSKFRHPFTLSMIHVWLHRCFEVMFFEGGQSGTSVILRPSAALLVAEMLSSVGCEKPCEVPISMVQ